MAALEVQNVRKAISRYGTLPKGARIGAYLESLRQNEIGTCQEQNVGSNTAEQKKSSPRSLSPRTNIQSQPQMIRSNSSSGVTVFHSHPQNSQIKNLHANSETGSNLRTFNSAQNKNFKGSPSHTTHSSLAYLEFPPPPTDLPPSLEELASPSDDNIISDINVHLLKPKVPMSPITCKKLNLEEDDSNKNVDVVNLQPSVEEASSRFGVSLRKKELSSDSCNSTSDGKEEKDISPQRSSFSSFNPSQGGQNTNFIELSPTPECS